MVHVERLTKALLGRQTMGITDRSGICQFTPSCLVHWVWDTVLCAAIVSSALQLNTQTSKDHVLGNYGR